MSSSRWLRGFALALGLASITALAVWARSVDRAVVLRPAGVVFYGSDAYYHMRRVAYGLERFPDHLEHDPYLHHPQGAVAIWPPLFDVGVTWGLHLASVEDLETAEVVAAWIPVFLGALTVLAIGLAGRQILGSWSAGLLAAFLLALLAGHVRYSRVGLLDHHVALGIAALGWLSLGAGSLRRSFASISSILAAAGLGAWLALAILLWPGCLLFLALLQPVQWIAIGRAAPASRRARTVLAALAHLAAAVVLAIGCSGSPWAERGELTLTTLSWLQPAIAGALAAGWLLAAGLLTREGHRLPRAVAAYAGLLLLSVLAAAAFPAPREALLEAWRWLSKDEAFQSGVAESKPLFREDPGGYGHFAHEMFSYLVYLLPVLSLWQIVRGWRGREPGRLLLGTTALVLFAITLLQARFTDMTSVPAALVLASPLEARPRARRRLLPAIWVGITLISLWPCLAPLLDQARRGASEGGRPELTATDLYPMVLHGTARWIRENTPETAGFFDPSETPEYGLMGWWDLGHVLQYTARRPTVVDNFGDDLGGDHFEDALRFHRLEDEAEAVGLLEEYRVRYAVTRGTEENTRRSEHLRRVVTRLHHFDGRALDLPGERVPAIQGFRLIYESRKIILDSTPADAAPQVPAAYKVFERVPGAVIVGRASPGSPVRALLELTTNRGRSFVYVVQSQAGAEGRYALRVPYATETDAPQAKASGPYQIETPTRRWRVRVPESAVRSGGTVEVQ